MAEQMTIVEGEKDKSRWAKSCLLTSFKMKDYAKFRMNAIAKQGKKQRKKEISNKLTKFI